MLDRKSLELDIGRKKVKMSSQEVGFFIPEIVLPVLEWSTLNVFVAK